MAIAVLILFDGLANWAVENPPAALKFAPPDPRLLAAAADQALAGVQSPSDPPRAQDLARQALARDATEVAPLRDLGLIAAWRGEAARATRLMALAGRRSPLDGVTHLWLMSHRLAAGDYDEGLRDADVLLRHAPALGPTLTPILIAYAAPARAALEGRLATDPPWGPGFLIALANQARDPAVAWAILSDLNETSAKPTAEEWTAYFQRRVKDGAYEQAYLDWLRTLPPAALAHAKSIYDGDFVGLPGPPPFNWRLGGGLGGEADLDGAAGASTRALHARYSGYGAPELAEQMLVLGPGSYRFSGEARASPDASDALTWRVSCADASGVVLAQLPLASPGPLGDWRPFTAQVQVPASGCAAQWLRLVPSPTDHVRPVDVWYRSLAMDRLG